MGLELDLDKINLQQLSRYDRKRLTDAHHDKYLMALDRITQAQENLLQKLLTQASDLRRAPIVEAWEKLSCYIDADEYHFYRLPDALEGGSSAFFGIYFVCHSDKEHMDGKHVLMTGMENRLNRVRYSQA